MPDPPNQARSPQQLVADLVDGLPHAAVLIDGDKLWCNRCAEEITGRPGGEISSVEAWFELLPDDHNERSRQEYERHRAAGFPEPFTQSIARPDGDRRTVVLTAQQFDRIELWLLDDITDRIAAEQALKESRDQLQAVVDTAIEGIITIDAKGAIQSFNRAAEQMFGYQASEMIGRNVSMLMPSPHREKHDTYISDYLETGVPKIIGAVRELEAVRKDGTVFPIELAVGEVDHLQRFTGVIRDISERRAAEEHLSRADRLSAIGTLAAGLGHDMNNLLLPIRARLEALEHIGIAEPGAEHLKEIRKSIRYLQDLTDTLHLLALDPEDAEASDLTTDLIAWWDDSRTLLSRAVTGKVRFSASIPSALPPITVAGHRLTQAVLNLLVNATKAVGAEGRIRLWAETNNDNTHVCLGITDDGCGMTDEVRRKALDPFFTTKARGLGTGLGLSLVASVVRDAGGTLEIDSAPGAGTTITLAFPIAEPALSNDHEPATTDALHEPKVHATITIADQRVASIVEHLLGLHDAEPEPGGGCADGTCSVWITDLSGIQERPAGLTDDCRVVLVAPGADPPDEFDGDLTRADPADFDSLRNAIANATRTQRR